LSAANVMMKIPYEGAEQMNRDFMRIQSLEGELKYAHKRMEVGLTVSTREFVLQKPHVNYHVTLEDIISIVPYESMALKKMTIINHSSTGDKIRSVCPGAKHYRVHVKQATMHNRSGIHLMGQMEFVLSIAQELLAAIAEYSGLRKI
jgi:hypothetical protein